MLTARYNKIEADYDAAKAKKRQQGARRKELEQFVKMLDELPDKVEAFSSAEWGALVDFLTVYEGNRVMFTFKNGMEIELK